MLGLVNNDVAWGKLGIIALLGFLLKLTFFNPPVGESVLKRIWCELCKAVGWMHGVGLVHRDIKLESKVIFSDR